MISERLPLLLEDGSRLDWVQARYKVDVLLQGNRAYMSHELSHASELDALIADGIAVWVTELRCPRTLVSRQEHTSAPEQAIALDGDDLLGDAFLIPGLVAARDVKLSTRGLNSFVWPEGVEIKVPRGWWLCKGDPRATTPLTASLIRLRRDREGWLSPGQMAVEEQSDGGKPYFEVILAEDLYDARREDRTLQIAALIAACGRLPRSTMASGEENDDHPVAMQLRARLEEADLDWDSEDFDPARAATVLESFDVVALDDIESS